MVDRGRVEERKARYHRVWLAQLPFPIFEAAYGSPASANGYPSGTASMLSPLADFVYRVLVLIAGKNGSAILGEVLTRQDEYGEFWLLIARGRSTGRRTTSRQPEATRWSEHVA